MKLAKFGYAFCAIALSVSLLPSASWSSRALAPIITGTITAAPSSGTIEVDRRSYHVKANSAAAKALGSLYVGETVDMIVEGSPNGSNAEVVSIMQHKG